LALSVLGLTLSGAPSLALLLGGSLALLCLWDTELPHRLENALWLSGLCLLSAAVSLQADLWQWRIRPPHATWNEWRTLLRLLLWFTWPAWPLALWTLWRWRHQWCSRVMHRHLLLPLWLVVLTTTSALITASAERTLLLALPPLAALAAFALPTLQRSVSALIDWFTLLFFSGCAFVIWVVWVAVQPGWPAQPAANVARLLPGFGPSWDGLAFSAALIATLIWLWLVKWRVGRHRAALWKSLVLPAGGAALCWLLLMSLWLPLLDFARSYGPLVRNVNALMGTPACIQVYGMNRAQMAAFLYHGSYKVRLLESDACEWLVIDVDALAAFQSLPAASDWVLVKKLWRPSDKNENVILFKRTSPATEPRHE
jgi:4-amino-4-deoxy-L-arabinose transferase-like glycosyltransferase